MSRASEFPASPRRVYVEDAEGNRGYLSGCEGECQQRRNACPTPSVCFPGKPPQPHPMPQRRVFTWWQKAIALYLTAMLLVFLAGLVAGALADWAHSIGGKP
jgi:hypothetical protein